MAALERKLEETSVALASSESTLSSRCDRVQSPAELSRPLQIAHCGIANATISSRVFNIAKTTVTRVWLVCAAMHLMVELWLLAKLADIATAVVSCRSSVLSHTVLTLKFDETNHRLSHQPTTAKGAGGSGGEGKGKGTGKGKVARRQPEQTWSVLVCIALFSWMWVGQAPYELSLIIPPAIMYGKTAAHLWSSMKRFVVDAILEILRLIWMFCYVDDVLIEQDSAAPNIKFLTRWSKMLWENDRVILWQVYCCQHVNHAIQGTVLSIVFDGVALMGLLYGGSLLFASGEYWDRFAVVVAVEAKCLEFRAFSERQQIYEDGNFAVWLLVLMMLEGISNENTHEALTKLFHELHVLLNGKRFGPMVHFYSGICKKAEVVEAVISFLGTSVCYIFVFLLPQPVICVVAIWLELQSYPSGPALTRCGKDTTVQTVTSRPRVSGQPRGHRDEKSQCSFTLSPAMWSMLQSS